MISFSHDKLFVITKNKFFAFEMYLKLTQKIKIYINPTTTKLKEEGECRLYSSWYTLF